MSLTRGQLLDRVAAIMANDSASFRTFLATSLNKVCYAIYDLHDWTWKHKSSSFTTVNGTESYNLSTGTTDLRSSEDLEVVYDTTNKRFLTKIDLRDIRKHIPSEDESGQPSVYAPWGSKTIYLSPIPNGTYTIKFLYLAKFPGLTDDSQDLETVGGIPDYLHYLIEQMLIAEGMFWDDDTRRGPLVDEILKIWRPLAIQADMKHLDNSTRLKFWEEELGASAPNYNDFLRRTWWNDNGY